MDEGQQLHHAMEQLNEQLEYARMDVSGFQLKRQAYEDVKDQILTIIESMDKTTDASVNYKTLVELGNDMFVRAKVDDCSMIFLDVGLGFHVELTLNEALVACDKMSQHFQSLQDQCVEKEARLVYQQKRIQEALTLFQQLRLH